MAQARAAIAAMHEPTDEMIVAAEDEVPCLSCFAARQASPAYIAYQAMLAEALKD
jgi:hypothetical protein